jgi:hypothetical protein
MSNNKKIETAKQLLDNTSYMSWLTESQKLLVEIMMETYSELKKQDAKDLVFNLEDAVAFADSVSFDGADKEDFIAFLNKA